MREREEERRASQRTCRCAGTKNNASVRLVYLFTVYSMLGVHHCLLGMFVPCKCTFRDKAHNFCAPARGLAERLKKCVKSL